MIAEMTVEMTEQMPEIMAEMTERMPEITAEMTEWMLQITKDELIPFLAEGIGIGFAMGTIFALLAYGIYKAIGLLNINHR